MGTSHGSKCINWGEKQHKQTKKKIPSLYTIPIPPGEWEIVRERERWEGGKDRGEM